jgi:hypothetical protein
MPPTALEEKGLASGERHQVIRALKAAGVPTSVLHVIASGDSVALCKAVGATGPKARAIMDGDEASQANNLAGLL